mgnify:CR=1 FL=1
MALSSELLQNVGLFIEVSHELDDFLLCNWEVWVVLTEEPARVVLELRVGIAEELELQLSYLETVSDD